MDMFIRRKKILFIIGMLITISLISATYAKKDDLELYKTIYLNNNNISLKFDAKIKTHNDIVTVYKDKVSNEYLFKNENMIGFLENKRIEKNITTKTDNVKIETSDIQKNEMLKNINLNDYKLDNVIYTKDYGEMFYTYVKYINDIKTNDFVDISFNVDGTLSSYSAPNQGIFDHLITRIKQKDINEFIKRTMEKKYKNVKYNIESTYLDYQNDKYIVVCDVTLYYNDYNEMTELIFSL